VFLFERILGENTTNIEKKTNIENFVTLKYIVYFRYKMIDKDYFDFTYSLKQFYIFIYKSYYVSDQKTKQVSIFVRKYITRISQVKKLQDSKLLSNIEKNIHI
jgi:hypothetical protein